MRWRLILKEFGPVLKHIKVENNVGSDALSWIEMSDNQDILNISEIYGYNGADLPDNAYPIRYHDISKAQKTDAELNQNLVSHKDYTLNNYCGANQNPYLIFRNDKICLPVALQKKIVDWYHRIFYHLGETRTEHTLSQHF